MAVIRKEAFYSSCNGINDIRALIWTDDEIQPKAVIQIAHGVCEHIGRYDEFARFLVSKGYVVCGNDHLGHGKSVLCEELLGICDDGDNVNMVRDMNTLHNIMAKRYSGLPYVIMGHSMGSFLARIYAAAFGDSLSAAIFCGTGQLPSAVYLLKDPVDYLLGQLPPESTNINIFNDIFCKFTKHVLSDDDDFAWISKNKENLEKYRADELVGFKLSTSLSKELITLAVKASAPDWASKLPKDLPVMLISGAKDPIGFFGTGVLKVSDNLMKEGIVPEVILYPGDRHEILNEEDREKVYADVAKFLASSVG